MITAETLLQAALVVLALAFGTAFVRLLLGPSLADRVIALDIMSAIAIAFAATYAVLYRQTSFLDVAVLVALVSFLGTVSFAYYLQRRARQ
jgi:multicomponent Na+:H+ antiporter subunit F